MSAGARALAAVGALALGGCAGCPGGPPPAEDAGVPGVTLSVGKSGDGAGSFLSDPEGIDCDTACAEQTATIPLGTTLSLRIIPARDANLIDALCGVTFPDGSTANRDPVADDEDAVVDAVLAEDPDGTVVACSAEFRQVHTLQILFSGTGGGSVTGALTDQAGGGGSPRIACPPDCVAGYFVGEVDTLTPTADPGSVFVEWKVDCSGAGAAQVTLDEDKNCEAVFDLQ